MIAQILPLDASHDSEGLTYFVPETLRTSIAAGQLVDIPFREEIMHGIVASVLEWPGEIPEEIRSIASIVFPTPVLSLAQIQTILETAKSSAIHIHKVVALFLTKPVLHRILKYGVHAPEFPSEYPPVSKPKLHFVRDGAKLAEYCAQFESKRTVFIVPSDWYVSRIQAAITGENIGTFSNDLTETKRAQLWLDIRSGKYETLIWTRRLCTYNLDNFDRIVYLEDAIMKEMLHSFHRYSCVALTTQLAAHAGQQLHVVSTTPSIAMLSRTLASHFELINA